MNRMPKRKSIAFILPNMHQGGAERIVLNLLQQLENSNYDCYLILLQKEGYYLEMLPDSVKLIDLKTARIRNSVFKILKTIRKIKPELVFSGYGEVNALLSPFLKKWNSSQYIARETNVVSEHVTRPEIRFFYRFYNAYDAVVAQSEDMKTDLEQNWNVKPEKIVKIHNPVNTAFIQEKSEAFYPEEFQGENKKVVAMGNVSYRKGFDHLLSVFMHLKNEPIDLFIIGEGPQMTEFQNFKEVNELSQVYFVGLKDNPFPYLKNADLFVLSSRYEGFPNVLLEAGACGTYSLANDCKGGINEIIVSGVNGEIQSIENTKKFAQEIKRLVHIPFDSRIIQESIESRFQQDKIFQKYLSLFNHLTE